jgi:hypothetical protein
MSSSSTDYTLGIGGATTVDVLSVNSGNASVNLENGYSGTEPTITLTTGISVIISISANIKDPTKTATTGFMSFVVSGASSIAASDANSISAGLSTSSETGSVSRTFKLTNLKSGLNTFTAVYKVVGGTAATFSNRDIVVFPL